MQYGISCSLNLFPKEQIDFRDFIFKKFFFVCELAGLPCPVFLQEEYSNEIWTDGKWPLNNLNSFVFQMKELYSLYIRNMLGFTLSNFNFILENFIYLWPLQLLRQLDFFFSSSSSFFFLLCVLSGLKWRNLDILQQIAFFSPFKLLSCYFVCVHMLMCVLVIFLLV